MSVANVAFEEGFRYGRDWKLVEGESTYLDALRAMRNDLRDFEWQALFEGDYAPQTCAEWFAGCIIGDNSDPVKCRAFWKWAVEAVTSEWLDDVEFVRGFAAGALAESPTYWETGAECGSKKL